MRKPIWVTLLVLTLAAGIMAPGGEHKAKAGRQGKKKHSAAKQAWLAKRLERVQKRVSWEKKKAQRAADELNRADSEETRKILTEVKNLYDQLIAATSSAIAAGQKGDRKAFYKHYTEHARIWNVLRPAESLRRLERDKRRVRESMARVGDAPELAALAEQAFRIQAKLAANYRAEMTVMQERGLLRAEMDAATGAFQEKMKEAHRAKQKARRKDKDKKKTGGKKDKHHKKADANDW